MKSTPSRLLNLKKRSFSTTFLKHCHRNVPVNQALNVRHFSLTLLNVFDVSVENSTEYGKNLLKRQYFWKLDGSDENIRYA